MTNEARHRLSEWQIKQDRCSQSFGLAVLVEIYRASIKEQPHRAPRHYRLGTSAKHGDHYNRIHYTAFIGT